MERYAVIVAGGSGSRMGAGIPKQFRTLNGHPVLWWSMKAFHEENPLTKIILVLPADFISLWSDLFSSMPAGQQIPHQVTSGGASRSESVKNGLALVPSGEALVAIHDGARPLVSTQIIAQGWKEAEVHQAAIPGVPVTDSLRHLDGCGSNAVNRDEFVAVQTPQVFNAGLLKKAYELAGDGSFTDDAAVMENAGHKIRLFPGSPVNIKITNPKDIALAAVLMSNA